MMENKKGCHRCDPHNFKYFVYDILKKRDKQYFEFPNNIMELAKLILQTRQDTDDPKLIATLDLMMAVTEGDIDKVCDGIKNGGNPRVTVPTYQGVSWCLLTIAARLGCTQIGSLLLDKGLPVEGGGTDHVPPLMHAAANGSLGMVKLLLSKGADPLRKTDEGQTALGLAALHGEKDCVAALIPVCPPVSADYKGYTPVHAASSRGHLQVLEMLSEANWPFSIQDPNNGHCIPLHYAATSGSIEVLKYVAQQSPRVVTQDPDFPTPFELAVIHGSHSMKMWFLQSGNVVLSDPAAYLRLMRMEQSRHESVFYKYVKRLQGGDITAATQACVEGDEYLVDHQGMTLLHWAAYKGWLVAASELLRAGVNPHVLNYHALTPEDLAQREEHLAVVKIFEQHKCLLNRAPPPPPLVEMDGKKYSTCRMLFSGLQGALGSNDDDDDDGGGGGDGSGGGNDGGCDSGGGDGDGGGGGEMSSSDDVKEIKRTTTTAVLGEDEGLKEVNQGLEKGLEEDKYSKGLEPTSTTTGIIREDQESKQSHGLRDDVEQRLEVKCTAPTVRKENHQGLEEEAQQKMEEGIATTTVTKKEEERDATTTVDMEDEGLEEETELEERLEEEYLLKEGDELVLYRKAIEYQNFHTQRELEKFRRVEEYTELVECEDASSLVFEVPLPGSIQARTEEVASVWANWMNSADLHEELLKTISRSDEPADVSRLVCCGAPFEPVGGSAVSALQLAIETDRPKTVNLLLASGASIVCSRSGHNLLQMAWNCPNITPQVLASISSAFTQKLRLERTRLRKCTRNLVKSIGNALKRYVAPSGNEGIKFEPQVVDDFAVNVPIEKGKLPVGVFPLTKDVGMLFSQPSNSQHEEDEDGDTLMSDVDEETKTRCCLLKRQMTYVKQCGTILDRSLKFLLKELEGETPWKAAWQGRMKLSNTIVLSKLMALALRANCLVTAAFLKWAGAWTFLSGTWGASPVLAALESAHMETAEATLRDLGGCPYLRDADGRLPLSVVTSAQRQRLNMMLYDQERGRLEKLEIREKSNEGKKGVREALKLQERLFLLYMTDVIELRISVAEGRTSMLLAARKGLQQFMYLLLNVGHFPVNAIVDETCESTALHQAASHGQTVCIALLLRNGADLLPCDRYKQTPILLAAMFGHKSSFHLLAHTEAETALKENRESQDPPCRAGTNAAEVKKNFTEYLNCYNKCGLKGKESITPLDRHEPERVTYKLLKALGSKVLRREAERIPVDFSKEENREVRDVILAELSTIMKKVTVNDKTYHGELRLVGSSRDGSKIYAPDEYDVNLVIDGMDVKIDIEKEEDKGKIQREGRLKIVVSSNKPQLQGNNMMSGLYHSVQHCLRDHTLQDKRLSMVPPGLTTTQVGVGFSLAWQGKMGDEKVKKYPLLLVGIDLVPMLEVPWHEEITRPVLFPKNTDRMSLTNTNSGIWRCSFAQTEAEVLCSLNPATRLVYLMGKIMLSCLKADPWMPQERRAFCTWFTMRAWFIPTPSRFCFKNAFLRWLEKNEKRTDIQNPLEELIVIFKSMCLGSVDQDYLMPVNTEAYFGGDCEGLKLGEGAPTIVKCLEEMVQEEKESCDVPWEEGYEDKEEEEEESDGDEEEWKDDEDDGSDEDDDSDEEEEEENEEEEDG